MCKGDFKVHINEVPHSSDIRIKIAKINIDIFNDLLLYNSFNRSKNPIQFPENFKLTETWNFVTLQYMKGK